MNDEKSGRANSEFIKRDPKTAEGGVDKMARGTKSGPAQQIGTDMEDDYADLDPDDLDDIVDVDDDMVY